jgi:Cupin-like domain
VSHVESLPKVEDLGRYEEFRESQQAVVFSGGARGLLAFEKWTDEYLGQTLVDTCTTVVLSGEQSALMRMSDFLDYLSEPDNYSSTHGPAHLADFYLQPAFGDPVRRKLAADVACPLPRSGVFAEWITLLAGPAGTSARAHQDMFSTHTWLAQLRGEKIWRLMAPSDRDEIQAHIDLFDSIRSSRRIFEARLKPGDLIFLPPSWWHQVENISATLAVAGFFCSVPHARASLDEARGMKHELSRCAWTNTWTAVLSELHLESEVVQ